MSDVPQSNLPWLKSAIERLNRKAARLALPAIELNITGERFVRYCNGCAAQPCTCNEFRKIYSVDVVGAAPSVDGWTFLGALDHLGENGNVVRALPGQEVPERYRTAVAHCDHCQTNRPRKSTYVLQKETEYKQVGSTCLQDFFSKDIAAIVARAEMLSTAAASLLTAGDESMGSGGSGAEYVRLDGFMAAVVASVEADGYVSKAKAEEKNLTPTATAAAQILFARRDRRQPETEDITITDAHRATAAAIIAWADTYLEKPDLNEYEHNLRVIVSTGFVGWHTFGLAASLSAFHYCKTAEIKERAAASSSVYVGEIGQRIKNMSLTLGHVVNLGDGEFGPRYLYKFTDAAGNLYAWFTGKALDADTEGRAYHVTATIKEHSEFRGSKQTVLTRCKLTSAEEPRP